MQDAFSRMELLVGDAGVKKSAGRRLQYSALEELVPVRLMHLQDAAWEV